MTMTNANVIRRLLETIYISSFILSDGPALG